MIPEATNRAKQLGTEDRVVPFVIRVPHVEETTWLATPDTSGPKGVWY